MPTAPTAKTSSASRPWRIRDWTAVAATVALMPFTWERFQASVIQGAQTGANPDSAFAWAAGMAVAELAVVYGAAALGGEYIGRAVQDFRGKLAEASHDAAVHMRTFFDENRIQQSCRKAVLTNQHEFADAMRDALAAAGTPFEMLADHQAVMFVADARDMDPILGRVLALPEMRMCDVTLIGMRSYGDDAPAAVRRLADGTSVAAWMNSDGTPGKIVGYAQDGSPAWVKAAACSEVQRGTTVLASEHGRDVVLQHMADACVAAAERYQAVRSHMLDTLPPDHSIREEGGVMTVRDADGRLGNQSGCPAVLLHDGSMTYAIAGRRMQPPSEEWDPSAPGRYRIA